MTTKGRLPDGTELSDDQHALLVAMSKRTRRDVGRTRWSSVAALGWSTIRENAVLAELEALGLVVNTSVN